MVGNNETNFPHSLLLTDRHVLTLCKFFTKKSMVNVKLLETQLSQIM